MNDMQQLASQVLDAARTRGWMIASAESCTGGLIAANLTEIAGSSDVVGFGFVTYSNKAKTQLLGVSSAILEQFGAVSVETAQSMAQGALRKSGADLAISVTGIAGPGGGVSGKPVGTVCFGLASPNHVCLSTREHFNGDRHAVRQQSTAFALNWLLSTCDPT